MREVFVAFSTKDERQTQYQRIRLQALSIPAVLHSSNQLPTSPATNHVSIDDCVGVYVCNILICLTSMP